MNKNPLFELYEKMYFHEIEVREQLGGRLQTPMAIVVSLIGVLFYLLQNYNREQINANTWLFLGLLISSGCVLIFAIFFFIRSWYGHTYAFLPSATETEKYRLLLETTYQPYNDSKSLVEKYTIQYLCNKYIECATQNTQCNDLRSLFLHKTNGALILATALVAFALLDFYLGDMDTKNSIKPTEIVIVKPVDVKGSFMPDTKTKSIKDSLPPPPPPPPPATRQIKEGVEIVKPKSESEKKNVK